MLAAANRLKNRRDIARVFQRGRYGSDGRVVVKAAANQLGHSRAVVVVGKKVSKKAVVRNRNRRRVGSIIAESWATVMPGYDIVVTVREDMADVPVSEVKRQITTALQRAAILTGNQ